MHTGKSFSPTSSAPTLVSSGNKRKRETDLENSDMYNFESPVDLAWINENVSEADVVVWQEQDKASHTPFQHMSCESKEEQSEEFSSPHSKRKFTDSSVASDCQPLLQAWSQDPLFSSSQYTDSEFSLSTKKNTPVKNTNDAEPSFLNNLQSLDSFGLRMDLEEKTSTQKHFHSSQMDGEKENSRSLSSNSPNKHSFFSHPGPLSNHKWTQPKTPSPQQLSTKQQWRKADNEKGCNSPAKWTKLRSSPLKRALQQQCNETEEDTMAMLFTQDSEGLRVIAHRGLLPRSPLKDQSNVTTGIVRTSIYKSLLEDDEEDELLFTQDSQGNVVIKH
uniref:Uncharacterized protein n=2 Tax=Mastacembelus armatus TaxID=205130 RepID=A0A3Q3S8J6_9TELE